MGYHLTTSLDLPPARAPASPKTHTPLPRLQERGHRFYSAEVGRWVSRDPINEIGGSAEFRREEVEHLQPRAEQEFVFCRNNPTSLIDPYGLWVQIGCTNASGGGCANCHAPCRMKRARWWPGQGYAGTCQNVSELNTDPGPPDVITYCACCTYEKIGCERKGCQWCVKLRTKCVDPRTGELTILNNVTWGPCWDSQRECEQDRGL